MKLLIAKIEKILALQDNFFFALILTQPVVLFALS